MPEFTEAEALVGFRPADLGDVLGEMHEVANIRAAYQSLRHPAMASVEVVDPGVLAVKPTELGDIEVRGRFETGPFIPRPYDGSINK